MTRVCTKCKIEFPRTSKFFPQAKDMRDGLSSWCRKCHRDKASRRRNDDPDAVWASQLKHKHGMTVEQYEDRYKQQDGVCASCGDPETDVGHGGMVKRLGVDHDHSASCGHTGSRSCMECNRDLLCLRCNWIIGLAQEDPGFLQKIASYWTQLNPGQEPPSPPKR